MVNWRILFTTYWRGLANVAHYIAQRAGKAFLISNEDVREPAWRRAGFFFETTPRFRLFPDGEPCKRLAKVENLAAQMIARGGDRSRVILVFGDGISGATLLPGGALRCDRGFIFTVGYSKRFTAGCSKRTAARVPLEQPAESAIK